MAGRREKREKRRAWKGILLAVCVTAGFTVTTPLTPTLDAPLGSVAAAAAPAAQKPKPGLLPESWAAFPGGLPEPWAKGAQSGGPFETAAEKISEPAAEPAFETETEPAAGTEAEDAPVEAVYFSDAAFVGDSRTEGFHLYSGLEEGAYFYAVGATVQTVLEKETQEGPKGAETILDALSRGTYGKIYIMLGVNELGWYRTEEFTERYAKVLARVREDHPGAEIVVQSLPPVSAKQDAKRGYVNNDRIALFNGLLLELAEREDCAFLDVASAVTDENGVLPGELTTDGVHLNTAGCKRWLQYLRENPV